MPKSKIDLHLAGLLFVGNMDFMHLDTRKTKTALEAMSALQNAVTNWGCLLLASGGAFKPTKCFYHLILLKWMANGTWRYKGNHDNPAFQLQVPLANGNMAPIKHLSVNSPSSTLSPMTCPSGSSVGAFIQMWEKAQGWIDRVIVEKLNRWLVWFYWTINSTRWYFLALAA